MPRPRFHKLDPAKRERIIDTAGAEFARKGFSGASLNAIIEEAGISKGAFYYYFDDKADLFVTVVTSVRDVILDAEHTDLSALSADTFWETLAQITQRSMDYIEHHPWAIEIGRVLHQLRDVDAELTARVAPLLEEAQQIMRTLLERGRAIGTVRTDLPLDLLLATMQALDIALDRWFLDNWEAYDRATMNRFAQKTVGFMRRLLQPGPDAELDEATP